MIVSSEQHVADGPVCRLWSADRGGGSVTVSPGLTETATTVPGIGERRMLLVSSATFSGMKALSCAANLDRMRT